MNEAELPSRYERLARLGRGGGGEVWSVRDRHNGAIYALKVLAEDATESEMAALVREAVALSGLEGLGVPRVVGFGRLPTSGRAYMVRELVDGQSLESLLELTPDVPALLQALTGVAEQLTWLHRAGLLHGDIKPANIIIEPSGQARLVDLGLAAPWREGGSRVEGLTPRYAAPELLVGEPLTVRAEVYALGVTLQEILARVGKAPAASTLDSGVVGELRALVRRATAKAPEQRFPSADEFGSALSRAANLPAQGDDTLTGAPWPVVGIDVTSANLLKRARQLPPGSVLRIVGPAGSGRSALLRRLAWSLGVEGEALVWIDDVSHATADGALEAELRQFPNARNLLVLVDDVDLLSAPCVARLQTARLDGARLVLVGGEAFQDAQEFEVPPLDVEAAFGLVARAIPSLTERLVTRIVEATGRWPGELKRLLRRLDVHDVATEAHIERALGGLTVPEQLPDDPLLRGNYFLDHGRYNEARQALELVTTASLQLAVALARLDLGLGDAALACRRLREVETRADAAGVSEQRGWSLCLARALTGMGEHVEALERLAPLSAVSGAFGAEAMAYQGFTLALVGRQDEALEVLRKSVARAERCGELRVLALASVCQASALQRADRLGEARQAYQRAISAAEDAKDAGLLAIAQLNLAGLLKVSGDIAAAIVHFEAAVDMGRRSGRRGLVRQAQLNLANTDLYLGRLARVRAWLDALDEPAAPLEPLFRAQLLGVRAELAARSGRVGEAWVTFRECAKAYDELGRGVDAAEARLEGILVAAMATSAKASELHQELEQATTDLGDAAAHRPLQLVAKARVLMLEGEEPRARVLVDAAIVAAKEAEQREWVWRALDIRAELSDAAGQPLTARQDRTEALAILESIAARLPRDLREVYWNDAPRRKVRSLVRGSGPLRDDSGQVLGAAPTLLPQLPLRSGISSHTRTPLEQRLARILEINSDLLGEFDLGRLSARVTDHAMALLRAERGCVVLRDKDGKLVVHTSRSRDGDALHAEFSRSIADQVINSGEPMVSLNARDDARLRAFSSVHQMLLQSVACVPVRAPGGIAIGALYVETRGAPDAHFQHELPTLCAFADQVAIAIENARLINEGKERAEALARANDELAAAQRHLRELLGDRTESLKRARRKLRAVEGTLLGHFGYQGLVGTSAVIRRVYALIERIKDTDVPVLITGESGTGKEMVARAIHAASTRASQPLLAVNCGAVPESLLESELFGHVRGAFTGAERERKGLFRQCGSGTVFLDEVGEMSKKMQTSLLRVLQERKVRPVGGQDEESFEGRVFCATNRDLETAVAAGEFREDLYYRIHVVNVRLPPLRERTEDIPQLVDHFLGIFAARYNRPKKSVSREALRALRAARWPGNVRQLEHTLLNAWVMCDKDELDVEDIDVPVAVPQPAVTPSRGARSADTTSTSRKAQVTTRSKTPSQHRTREKERILKALKDCGWNRVRAAALLEIPRRTFYRRLRDYGIQ